MPKFQVHGRVVGSRYLGEFEAATAQEAAELALNDASISLCHQCSSQVEDPEVEVSGVFTLDDEEVPFKESDDDETEHQRWISELSAIATDDEGLSDALDRVINFWHEQHPEKKS